jgi:hypothetical protein
MQVEFIHEQVTNPCPICKSSRMYPATCLLPDPDAQDTGLEDRALVALTANSPSGSLSKAVAKDLASLLTVQEAAEFLCVSPKTIRKLLPVFRAEGETLLLRSDLVELLSACLEQEQDNISSP